MTLSIFRTWRQYGVSIFCPLTRPVLVLVPGWFVPDTLAGDAHVVVQGELVAVQHGRPGKPVGLHPALTASPDWLAERPAGVDGSLQADRGEQGAEEELGVRVTLDVQQGDPAHALLRHLVQGVVLHQVGQAHLGVAWQQQQQNTSEIRNIRVLTGGSGNL